MTKDISTLKRDIEHVLNTGRGWTNEISEWVATDAAKSLSRQFYGAGQKRKGTLRPSNLGTPCERKLWYSINSTIEPEPLPPSARNKFIFGDLTESYLLGLCKAAGHSVEGLQTVVDIDGIRGSRDCIIDGMLIDVKSASSYAFQKFKRNGLRDDDPFGYISQLSSYLYGSRNDPLLKEKSKAGFLVMDKQLGHIHLDIYDLTEEVENKSKEVAHKRAVVKCDTPPPRGYEPVEDGKSGNMKLGVGCSYCDFKHVCWPELRTFIYSSGPRYLTKVVKKPNVMELRDDDEGF